ncbi:hypothetical protein IFM89_008660 [Coptis chinensis]|uniref:Replication factor A C-terminal domain-containing protein n=1 Tax=Coptis chinensis TaxID=261450 RepID=A0A835LAK8_9MAGN|nr:hypothetical protein IFM89_008660 [Coptis chinensis]
MMVTINTQKIAFSNSSLLLLLFHSLMRHHQEQQVPKSLQKGSKDSQEKKKRFDVVLIDEQGNQIQAIVPKNNSNTFLNVLHEGHVYHIENFSVQTRIDSYRPIQHEYPILIRWDTIVRGSSEAHLEIPKYNFDFVEFNKIRLLPKENQNLQDVYGTLESVSELMFRKGLMLKEIFLKNSIGTELKINLWENAIQLMDNVITYATSVPVLVVTLLTVGSYYDQYFLNSTSATHIYVNLEIPEVLELQNSSTFKERNISVLQASSSVERNMKNRSLRNRKTLSQILHMLNADSVGQVFTWKAIINDIVHDYAPSYKSCTKIGCRKKVIDKSDHYWCNNCNNAVPSPDARYQVKARIQDDTESTLITIFGDEAEELLKHPASELAKVIESTRSPTKAARMFSGTQDKCATCCKRAYLLEKVSATVVIHLNRLCASFYLASGKVVGGAEFDVVLDNNGKDLDTVSQQTKSRLHSVCLCMPKGRPIRKANAFTLHLTGMDAIKADAGHVAMDKWMQLTNISHVRDLSSMLTSAVEDPIVSSGKIFNYVSFKMTPPGYLPLSDINDQNQNCRIKFRVSRKWSIGKRIAWKN